MANTSMQQASALTSLNGKPLIVLTADEGADDQWQSKQDHMATLSTNSLHRHANATHAFAPRRRSRRCRSQPGNPRRRRRGTHLPAACPALTPAWSWSQSSRRSVQPPSIDRVCDRNRFVPNNASRTAARPRDAQYDSPQAQAVKQAAWRAAVNGMSYWCARGDLNPHVLADTGT